jgi:putative lipoprotein
MRKLLFALSLALALSACGGAQPWERAFWIGQTRLERLDATSWSAEMAEGAPAKNASLIFTSDGHVSGSGGCNRYFGTAKVEGSTIRFGDMGVTKMMCTGDVMAQEDKFFDALNKARSYSIGWGGKLHLEGEKGEALAQFAPVKAVN